MDELLLVSFCILSSIIFDRGQPMIYCALGFCHDHALILYVYLTNTDSEDSALTVCDLFCCFCCLPLLILDFMYPPTRPSRL